MKLTTVPPVVVPNLCIVSCDVSMATLNLVCPEIARPGFRAAWEIANRSEPIRETLELILRTARLSGFPQLRVVVEPTGIYHRLLLRLARELGCETSMVNASHVVAMRRVVFGDRGKTDRRDPLAIDAVARQGRLIIDRQLPEVYQLMRHWSKLYDDAERALIDAKARIHRAITLLFPDFSFTTHFLYDTSGVAIVRCYGLNPHRIATQSASRLYERLRRHAPIRRSSVERLLGDARLSATSTASGRCNALLEHELALAWSDLEMALARRGEAREAIESLYREARAADPRLPAAQTNIVSAVALGRFFAEAGPLDDYASWRQLLKMGGLNLAERESGKYVGLTKITRTGRARMRVVLNRMALPLVRRGQLFGDYYHHKTGVEKMPGKKAMTAVSRKLVKMLWGWYHSGAAFDVTRVFRDESRHQLAA